MKTEIKTYKINDFIKKNVSGELAFDKSMAFARKFASIACLQPDHKILIDVRDTTVSSLSIIDVMKITVEIADNIPDFRNKIACVIPDNEERLHIARQFHSCLVLKGFSYDVFNDFEKAIEWLSDTSLTA